MSQRCFFFPPRQKIIVRRTAAMGDSLAATVVADKLSELDFNVVFQSHPHNHCILRRQRSVSEVVVPEGTVNVDLDGCYEHHPERASQHFSALFISAANRQLQPLSVSLGSPINCKPKLRVEHAERQTAVARFERYPRPWIFVCPRSNSWAARTVPDHIWSAAAAMTPGTKFWIGTTAAPPSFVDLQCRHVDNLILWLSVADMLVTVDTGPMHIGAALGVPIVALGQSSSPELHLSDQTDFNVIWPPGLDCLNCQKNICPKKQYQPPCQEFPPMLIAEAIGRRHRSLFTEDVSAIVAVYRPDAQILNRCLTRILPQVNEVIVCRDLAGKFPEGALKDPKIKYIVKGEKDIGYGRKANFAARHSNGRYLLFLNDDLYAGPTMVEKLRAAMTPGVAVAGPLLRFKDGRIQHAGMVRDGAGGVGFGHIDYGRHEPTFKTVMEVECVTGAAILVDRKAFYAVDGFNEEFYLYAEDTFLMMAIRQAGYKIMYVPEATGIHDEHLSTAKTPNIMKIMRESNYIFGQHWSWYFTQNKGRPGLGKFL